MNIKDPTYEKNHEICYGQVLFFVSRIGVVYDVSKRQQSFYEGHKLWIGAMAVHPFSSIVATGEVNIYPQIHVWDA